MLMCEARGKQKMNVRVCGCVCLYVISIYEKKGPEPARLNIMMCTNELDLAMKKVLYILYDGCKAVLCVQITNIYVF